MRTENGLPVRGMVGVKKGASAAAARSAGGKSRLRVAVEKSPENSDSPAGLMTGAAMTSTSPFVEGLAAPLRLRAPIRPWTCCS